MYAHSIKYILLSNSQVTKILEPHEVGGGRVLEDAYPRGAPFRTFSSDWSLIKTILFVQYGHHAVDRLRVGFIVACYPAEGWTFGNGRFAWPVDATTTGRITFKRALRMRRRLGQRTRSRWPRVPHRCSYLSWRHSLASLPSTTTAAHEIRECSGAGRATEKRVNVFVSMDLRAGLRAL